MRILLTGAKGMLGRDMQIALRGHEVTATGREELNITDSKQVAQAVRGHDVVVNAAAFTDVDRAESEEDEARLLNAVAVAHLAKSAAAENARFIHFSTDYVFAGEANRPYVERDELSPVSAYGRTKAEGELAALRFHPHGSYIVRTAWLYGAHGKNFVATMLRLAQGHETVSVVTDQIGQPTWTMDLAQQTRLLLENNAPPGIYHGTNSGSCSWYEFARTIFEEFNFDPDRVRTTTSEHFPRPAQRPAYSVLGHNAWSAAQLAPMRDWREAFVDAVRAGSFSLS